MKDRIIKLINERNVNDIFDLYRVVHELEIQDFKDTFFKTNKECIAFEDKNEMPLITITAHEEPLQMLVLEIRKEGNSVVVVCDNYGDIDTYCLCDVEKGHLDFLKDYLV